MAAREFEFDDLLGAVGTDLGYSRYVAIDQSRIDAFAEATEDRQWIHVDPERAAAGPFGATIAHGYLTLSLVSVMVADLITVRGIALAINYGSDRVRFPEPVRVGNRVRGHGQLLATAPLPGAVQTTIRVTVQAEGATKPACVADIVSRFVGEARSPLH